MLLNGGRLTKPEEQLERWKEHFSRLLSGKPVEHSPDIEADEELQINMGPITAEEIYRAIVKIEEGKAPGPDNISPEALRTDTTNISTDDTGTALGHLGDGRNQHRLEDRPYCKAS